MCKYFLQKNNTFSVWPAVQGMASAGRKEKRSEDKSLPFSQDARIIIEDNKKMYPTFFIEPHP